jgi:hypothetical protein
VERRVAKQELAGVPHGYRADCNAEMQQRAMTFFVERTDRNATAVSPPNRSKDDARLRMSMLRKSNNVGENQFAAA